MLPRDPFTLAALAAHLARLGKYFPNQYRPPRPGDIKTPSGQYNKGSGYEERPVRLAPKDASAWMTEPKVFRPTGAYNKGQFKENKDIVDTDPWGGYYFSFELDKVEVARFMECSGLKNAAEIFEIEEGGRNDTVFKRPGYTKWDNITLKKALWKGHLFSEWRDYYMQPRDSNGKPVDGYARIHETTAAIVMRNNAGEELRRYTILRPWPISWEGPSLSSGGSDLALETLEIAHEGILTPLPGTEVKIPEKPVEPEPEYEAPEFDHDSYGLQDEQGEKVDEAAAVFEEEEITEVWVEGHTSMEAPTQKKYDYNMKLGFNRALTVAQRLTKDNPNLVAHVTSYSWAYQKQPSTGGAEFGGNRRTEYYHEESETAPKKLQINDNAKKIGYLPFMEATVTQSNPGQFVSAGTPDPTTT